MKNDLIFKCIMMALSSEDFLFVGVEYFFFIFCTVIDKLGNLGKGQWGCKERLFYTASPLIFLFLVFNLFL